MTAKQKAPLRDRLIPWYFVMAFMVVLAVNIVFVRTALQSNPGVVTEHAYEKGLAYNQVLERIRAEKALGWHMDLTYSNGDMQLVLKGADGRLLTGAKAEAFMERPLQAGMQQKVTLEQREDGTYAAQVAFPQPGQWDITVSITWNEQYLQMHQRLVVP